MPVKVVGVENGEDRICGANRSTVRRNSLGEQVRIKFTAAHFDCYVNCFEQRTYLHQNLS